jgi:glycosyltransferase involved in cell wall biosynthesis
MPTNKQGGILETLTFLQTSSFYPPYHLGGDALHVNYLAEELVKLGHKVHVLYSKDAYRVKRKKTDVLDNSTSVITHTIDTPLNYTAYSAYLLGESSRITKTFQSLVKTAKPNVVHHHNISLLGYPLLKKQTQYVNLYTAHDFWLICQQNNLLRNGEICTQSKCFWCNLKNARTPQLWRRGEKIGKLSKQIDLMICPSNFLKTKISERFSINMTVLPNFVPSPPKKIEPSGFFNYFLYAGLLEDHKGIMNLVRAFKESNVDAKLVVAGTGRLFNAIQQFIRIHDLEGKILLLGWVEHNSLYSLLKDANALLIPSICAENAPLSALEALSVGTPVIASNVGGLPEILQHVDRQLIYANKEALISLLREFSKEQYADEKLKTVYQANFSPQAYVKDYLSSIKPYLL